MEFLFLVQRKKTISGEITANKIGSLLFIQLRTKCLGKWRKHFVFVQFFCCIQYIQSCTLSWYGHFDLE